MSRRATVLQMNGATLYYDVISPFAYLLHASLQRAPLPVPVQYRPLLFAGLLKANAHKGPAEIPSKRRFTYEFCTWFAHEHGIAFRMPSQHPFNPLRYLRLIAASGDDPELVDAIFRQLFTTGDDPAAPETFEQLLSRDHWRTAAARIDDPAIKSRIHDNTEEALSRGVFGVPTLCLDGHLFWGVDALPMVRSYLRGDAIHHSEAMQAARETGMGVTRRQVE